MRMKTTLLWVLAGATIALSTATAKAYSGHAPNEVLAEMASRHLTITKPTAGGKSGDKPEDPHHLPEVVFLQPGEYFTRVTVHSKSAIDALELTTSSGRKLYYANIEASRNRPRETDNYFDLTKDQYISQIDVQQGRYKPEAKTYTVVARITFHIMNRDGTTQPPKAFGQNFLGGKTTKLAAAPNNEICGFWGWYSTVMDCIGIIERARN
jgi:hypothetical protein